LKIIELKSQINNYKKNKDETEIKESKDLAHWIKVRRVDFLRRLVGKFKNLLTGAMGNVVHVPPTW